MADIISSLMATFSTDPVSAVLLIVIGIVLGVVIDKVLSMSMMGMGMV